jgi:CheY-like chemotaxis protein
MPTKPTLLITEDDIDLREALVETLSHLPIQIIEAENGKIGFERAMKDKPTAILSDINMPEMTGLQFLAEYRAWGWESAVCDSLRLCRSQQHGGCTETWCL